MDISEFATEIEKQRVFNFVAMQLAAKFIRDCDAILHHKHVNEDVLHSDTMMALRKAMLAADSVMGEFTKYSEMVRDRRESIKPDKLELRR